MVSTISCLCVMCNYAKLCIIRYKYYIVSVNIILSLKTFLFISSIFLIYINEANISIISSVQFHMWSYNSLILSLSHTMYVSRK